MNSRKSKKNIIAKLKHTHRKMLLLLKNMQIHLQFKEAVRADVLLKRPNIPLQQQHRSQCKMKTKTTGRHKSVNNIH